MNQTKILIFLNMDIVRVEVFNFKKKKCSILVSANDALRKFFSKAASDKSVRAIKVSIVDG